MATTVDVTPNNEHEELIELLRKWFPKGSTVYTVLRHAARSGMSRTIGVIALTVTADGLELRHPNHATAAVLGLKEDRQREGVKISGGGMDMGFHLVYSLGEALYGDGYSLSQRWL